MLVAWKGAPQAQTKMQGKRERLPCESRTAGETK
jgi:hypothetical protein